MEVRKEIVPQWLAILKSEQLGFLMVIAERGYVASIADSSRNCKAVMNQEHSWAHAVLTFLSGSVTCLLSEKKEENSAYSTIAYLSAWE